jgi:putative ABC transport system permease protein
MIFRKLSKSKTAALLGLAGLVVGIMCVIYIFLLVTVEVSYDRFHKNIDRIFVVHAYLEGGVEKRNFQGCPPAVSQALKSEYPEVETTCRYIPAYWQYLMVYGESKFIERTAYADFSFFDIFSFPFIYGDRGRDSIKNRVVLTETASKRYFGNSNPVGKILRMDDRINMTVAGVIKDIPKNSSITFDALIPVENIGFYFSRTDYLTTWYNNAFMTFGLLYNQAGFEKVASAITNRIQKELPESTNFLRAFKFKDKYLYEEKHIDNVRIFILIALLVLLAATLNFINLSTARSSKQAKETGLRKTFGASRANVIHLIYSEVAVTCLLAFLLAILLVYSGLPFINRLAGKEISFSVLFSLVPMAVLAGIYLLTVVLAGSYPAFFMSSFTPGQILSSNFQTVKSRGLVRNVLVVVVFTLSIVLLSSTLVVSQQTGYLQKLDLGFEKDQLMYVSLKGKLPGQVQTLKQEFNSSPDILSSCAVSYLPDQIGNNGEGWSWEGKDPNFKPLVTTWDVDEDLAKTFGIKFIEGDFLKKDQEGIVINETFAKIIGWNSFTGKTLNGYGTQYRILGVVRDVRFNSLRVETEPMVIQRVYPSDINYVVLKVNTANISKTIAFVQKICRSIEPNFPVEYAFLDKRYNDLLDSEINLKKLIGIFSVFAFIVLCLGLLGMVMFLIEQKTKEIGVRKCLGESVLAINMKLIRPFLISGIVSLLIAIPVTWYVMDNWLQNYAYRISLKTGTFILSGMIVIAISMLTVTWQTWRAATRNPVDALRYE